MVPLDLRQAKAKSSSIKNKPFTYYHYHSRRPLNPLDITLPRRHRPKESTDSSISNNRRPVDPEDFTTRGGGEDGRRQVGDSASGSWRPNVPGDRSTNQGTYVHDVSCSTLPGWEKFPNVH